MTRVEVPGHRIAQLAPVLWCRFGMGITVATGVSQWDDQSGNGNHLKQATGANQPTKQADQSILFDGVTQYLQAGAFTLVQPCTYYLLFSQISFTNGDAIVDGKSGQTVVRQITPSPDIQLLATSAAAGNAALAVGSYGAVCAVMNGASSVLRVGATEATGDIGAGDPGGFTLGASKSGSAASNIQVKEVIVYSGAHDAATRAIVIGYLSRVGGL